MYYGNEGLSSSNFIRFYIILHFYIILYAFILSYTLLCDFRTLLLRFPLLYNFERSYTVISKVFSCIYDGARVLLWTLCIAFIILWRSHKLFMTEKWLNILLKILRCNHCNAKESCVEKCVIRLFKMNDKKRNLVLLKILD